MHRRRSGTVKVRPAPLVVAPGSVEQYYIEFIDIVMARFARIYSGDFQDWQEGTYRRICGTVTIDIVRDENNIRYVELSTVKDNVWIKLINLMEDERFADLYQKLAGDPQ